MKEIKTMKEEIIRAEVKVYQATDGTTFKTEDECKKYEESALCAVQTRLNDKLLYIPTGWKEKKVPSIYFGRDVLFPCCDDYDFYIFKAESDEDLKNLIQWLKLLNTDTYAREFNAENYNSLAETVDKEDPCYTEDWDKYRLNSSFEELQVGKTYFIGIFDRDCIIRDAEEYKSIFVETVDDWLEYYATH